MDEQAGPGVFFNNNNNSALAGGPKAVQQPGDGGGEAVRAQYNIPGILHFLQHEWARFEVERAQWDVERAELQVMHLDILGNVFFLAQRFRAWLRLCTQRAIVSSGNDVKKRSAP